MNKVNTDNIPLTLLAEIDELVYDMAELGIFYVDKTISNEYVDQVVKILGHLGYDVKVFDTTYLHDAKSLSIEYGKPTKRHEDCELDCAIDITTAEDACMQARSNDYVFELLETVVAETYKAHKKGGVLKERLNYLLPIMDFRALSWLEDYYDIHAYTIDDGNIVVFEVKEVEI